MRGEWLCGGIKEIPRRRIARGLDIGRIALKMSGKAKLAETAGKTWEREFSKGVTNWSYWKADYALSISCDKSRDDA